MRLADLLRHPRSRRLSHSRLWANIACASATIMFLVNGWRGALTAEIWLIYLGVVAFRKWFLPALAAIWIAGALLIPSGNVFHYPVHVLGLGLLVAAVVLLLKPKDYDAHDVEVCGLYWHFVDLVWMFIFPLVYLMSTKVL